LITAGHGPTFSVQAGRPAAVSRPISVPRKDFVALTDLDRSLIQRCLAQETSAWQDFVDRFAGLFVRVVQQTAHSRSVPLSRDDADDLCGEVFLTVLANDFAVLRNFHGRSALATYLSVIARRVVVKEIIRRRMSEALGHVRAHHESLEQAEAEPRIDQRELVQQMLSGLPELEAEIVRQFHLDGRSYSEISRSLRIPENSIGPTLSRAREKLRKAGLPA
jgi:RNA polymerase sigma-70 factor (ECF subfamily)